MSACYVILEHYTRADNHSKNTHTSTQIPTVGLFQGDLPFSFFICTVMGIPSSALLIVFICHDHSLGLQLDAETIAVGC